VGDERALLIDTGLDATPQDHLEPYLRQIGLAPDQIDYVLITHADFDHMGGNAAVRQLAPCAAFLCHELDRTMIEDIERMITARYGEYAADHQIDDSPETKDWIRANARGVPIDIGLQGGESVRLGADWRIQILHTAGHSRGHLSVYDPRSRTAIITDTALGRTLVTTAGAPAFPPTYRYVEPYLASIQRLQGMPIETLLTSHFPVYKGDESAAFLAASRAYAEQVDAAVRDELRGSDAAVSMRELIERLAPRLGDWPTGAEVYLVYPLQGHLERMTQHGLIAANRGAERVTYRWAGS
jgi:glyoxylase-like metal-dependent hydrolase (beta-lactamase superfamily II)